MTPCGKCGNHCGKEASPPRQRRGLGALRLGAAGRPRERGRDPMSAPPSADTAGPAPARSARRALRFLRSRVCLLAFFLQSLAMDLWIRLVVRTHRRADEPARKLLVS